MCHSRMYTQNLAILTAYIGTNIYSEHYNADLTHRDSLIQGYGHKLGMSLLHQWQRKYLVLYPNRLEWSDSIVVSRYCVHVGIGYMYLYCIISCLYFSLFPKPVCCHLTCLYLLRRRSTVDWTAFDYSKLVIRRSTGYDLRLVLTLVPGALKCHIGIV